MASFLIPLITSAVGAIGGGLANRAQKTQQNSTTNTNSTQTTNPVYDAKTQSIRDSILNELMYRTESTPDFEDKYRAEGLANINKSRDAARANINNILASRGLSGSPIAANAEIQNTIGTAGQQSSFLNGIPLLVDNMRRERLQDLGGFFSSLPVGQTANTTGTQTTNGTASTPGNVGAGALSGGGQSLALLYGMGAFDKTGFGRPK